MWLYVVAESVGKAELLSNRYFNYLDRIVFPRVKVLKGSG
jgi:hypothetical protein